MSFPLIIAPTYKTHGWFAIRAQWHPGVGVNDGQCRMRRIALPAMPTVGAGSSQREDSPAHPPLYVYAQTTRRAPRFLSQRGVLGRNAEPKLRRGVLGARRGTPRRYKRTPRSRTSTIPAAGIGTPPSSSSRPGVDVDPQAAVAYPDRGRFASPLGRQVGQPTRHREAGDRRRGSL